jgi:hypothetical protein
MHESESALRKDRVMDKRAMSYDRKMRTAARNGAKCQALLYDALEKEGHQSPLAGSYGIRI